MVRCLGVFLVLMLLLCGCNQETILSTGPVDDTMPSVTTAPPGIYIPESNMEQTTAGAIRTYRVGEDCYGCFVLGDDILLVSQEDGEGKLSLYQKAELEWVKTVGLGKGVTPTAAQIQISDRGIGYFNGEDMVFLNTDLVETGRMHLPETLSGSAWLTRDWKSIYYCTDKGIWVLDLQTGISRLVKEQNAFRQEVTGCFGDAQVLRYELELTEGQTQILLIDTATGLALQENAQLKSLTGQGQSYFYPMHINGVFQLRFGRGEEHKVLWPAEKEYTPHMLFESNQIVMAGSNENGLELSCYDLETGKRTTKITLSGVAEISALHGDGKGGIWFLARAGEENTLCHWNMEKTRTEEETVYIAPFYTRESPDAVGLTQLTSKATELGDRFGVEILLWKNAVEIAPADYTFTEEFMTQVYEPDLAKLETLLGAFPEGFFSKASGEKLKIALVQEITGVPAWGGLEENTSLQFWNGNTPVLALKTGDSLERSFFHGMYHFMETRILSQSSALYEWNQLNPPGFLYDNSYIKNLERTDIQYTEGGNKYFIDLFSMSFPKEDRARIFEYACTAGNADSFQTWVMQNKLQRICQGIRIAFDLRDMEGKFLWEQYLQ